MIIGAHGNSIRGIVKHIQDLSSEEIMGIEIPTGIPFFYELSLPDLKPTGPMQFLGDPDVVAAAQLKVANQGKKK